jgi:hypothetical protein
MTKEPIIAERERCARLLDAFHDGVDVAAENERLREREAQAKTIILAARVLMPQWPAWTVAGDAWSRDADKWLDVPQMDANRGTEEHKP